MPAKLPLTMTFDWCWWKDYHSASIKSSCHLISAFATAWSQVGRPRFQMNGCDTWSDTIIRISFGGSVDNNEGEGGVSRCANLSLTHLHGQNLDKNYIKKIPPIIHSYSDLNGSSTWNGAAGRTTNRIHSAYGVAEHVSKVFWQILPARQQGRMTNIAIQVMSSTVFEHMRLMPENHSICMALKPSEPLI